MHKPSKHKEGVEPICYEEDHIDRVTAELKSNFKDYFQSFIESSAGLTTDEKAISELSKKFGTERPSKKVINIKERLLQIIDDSIKSFEKDRPFYKDNFKLEAFDEYADDHAYFKNTILKNECPKIRKALNSKEKELGTYRANFSRSNPAKLFTVTENLVKFACEYEQNHYDANGFKTINSLADLDFDKLMQKKDDYYAEKVIGDGTRSHFLYKLKPHIFPNCSESAIWALWYLTDKKPFGCAEDSEFLMIDTPKSTCQQNYFYPYDLFTLYALELSRMLEKEAINNDIDFREDYRFVILDDFLTYIEKSHKGEISTMKNREINHRKFIKSFQNDVNQIYTLYIGT